MEKIIGLKNLREHTEEYIKAVKKGESFVVIRKTVPVFKVVPVEKQDERWETIIDFTGVKKGGVGIDDILSRL